jgi:hypothetical protein
MNKITNTSSRNLTLPLFEDWVRILGAKDHPDEVPTQSLQNPNLAFERLRGPEREAILLRVLKTLQTPLEKAGAHRKSRWVQGWQETLDEFVASGHALTALQPKFVRRGEVMRLEGDYVQPATDSLEPAMVDVLRRFLFKRYFSPVKALYEFGAGTGHNMVAFAQQFPEKIIHALDWVQPSVEIFDLLRQRHGFPIHGHLFDLASPDPSLRIAPDSGIFTTGALEQLGDRFGMFLNYLLEQKPSICVHVETLYELYDQATLFDWVAAQYLEKRGYLIGFVQALKQLESQGRIEILALQRTFGSLYHDGYSYVAWRPRNK